MANVSSETIREAFSKNFSLLIAGLHAKDIADDLLTDNLIDFDLHCDLLACGEEEANVRLVKYFSKSCTPLLLGHLDSLLNRSATKFPKHADLAFKLAKDIKLKSQEGMRESMIIDSAFSEIQGGLAFNEVKTINWDVSDLPSMVPEALNPPSKAHPETEATQYHHSVLATYEQQPESQVENTSDPDDKPTEELDKAIDQLVEKLKTAPTSENSPELSGKPFGFVSYSPLLENSRNRGSPSVPRLLVQPKISPKNSPKGSSGSQRSSSSNVKAPKKLHINLLLLGDSKVGKSCLRQQYVSKEFSSAYKPTGGCDYKSRDLPLGNKNVVVKVWDSTGSVKYRSRVYTFYSSADACVLVFDLNNPASFENLEEWRSLFLQRTREQNFPFVVMGNKMDLVSDAERPIPTENVRSWCEKYGYPYFETNAQDEIGVEMAFVGTTRFVVDCLTGKSGKAQAQPSETVKHVSSDV